MVSSPSSPASASTSESGATIMLRPPKVHSPLPARPCCRARSRRRSRRRGCCMVSRQQAIGRAGEGNHDQLRPVDRGAARGFGKERVVTDVYPDPPVADPEHGEVRAVAEVDLLQAAHRRRMRLAVAAEYLALGVDHDCTVVAEACRHCLEYCGDNMYAVLALPWRAWSEMAMPSSPLRFVDVLVVAVLEDVGVVEELGHDHEIGAAPPQPPRSM